MATAGPRNRVEVAGMSVTASGRHGSFFFSSLLYLSLGFSLSMSLSAGTLTRALRLMARSSSPTPLAASISAARRIHSPPSRRSPSAFPKIPCSVHVSNRGEMYVGGSGGAALRSSIKKWKIIYPAYLNSKNTVAEGRHFATAKACPDPTCIKITDSCAYLKIPCAIELDKAYPRDFF